MGNNAAGEKYCNCGSTGAKGLRVNAALADMEEQPELTTRQVEPIQLALRAHPDGLNDGARFIDATR